MSVENKIEEREEREFYRSFYSKLTKSEVADIYEDRIGDVCWGFEMKDMVSELIDFDLKNSKN